MNVQERSEIRELTATQLDEVTGAGLYRTASSMLLSAVS